MKPLQTSGLTYAHREGVWVQLEWDNFSGVGEAAPLPGFSLETLKEVHYALEGFHQAVEGEEIDMEELFLLINLHAQKIPSVQFALETAVYDILAKEAKLKIAQYLNKNADSEIGVNGLNGIHHPGDGFSVVKVKVGIHNLFDEIDNLKYLTQSFGKNVKFRLDCNGAFDLPQAIRFCKEMGKFNIDYIEQPLPADNLEDLAELTYHTEFPIAVDESLTDFKSAEQIIEEQAADVFVIKPMISGGFTECEKIINIARNEKIRTVVTSSLETNIGRTACLHLALANEITEPCGLATGELLNEEITTPSIQDGKMNIFEKHGLGIEI